LNRPTEERIRAQYERALQEMKQLKMAGADAPYDEGIADSLGWVLGELANSPYEEDQ
jgi:hypothetical protein